MIFSTRNLVLFVLVATFAFAEDSSKPVQPAPEKKIGDPQPVPTPDPTTPSSNSTSTVLPKPTPTTTQEPTTQPPTKPTTQPTTKPTTPTTPPTTPTTPPTTPTTTVKPTPAPTPAPTTSTTQAPVTTPKPDPHKPESWLVKYPNGTACIIANMVIHIEVPYKSVENKTVSSKFSVDKVENATASGSCDGANNTQTLVVSWPNVTATYSFTLNVTDHTYSLTSVNVSIAVNNVTFPNNTMTNVTELQLMNAANLFTVPQYNSYTCSNVPSLSLKSAVTPSNTTVSGTLTVAHVQVQAFGNITDNKFQKSIDCASHETPDIVPIAVGLILAGLVVIVLVAYLIGRRRAQARGYLSM